MDAKYKRYYDKLKGVDLTGPASTVVSGFSSLSTNTSKLDSQISSSTWEELGLKSIKSSVIPAFKQAVSICQGNANVLQDACSESAALLSILESLEEACNKYENCSNDVEHASEKKSYYNKVKELESKADAKISSIKALSGNIQDVVITVDDSTSTETNNETNLDGLDTGDKKDDSTTTTTTTTTTDEVTKVTSAKGKFTYYCQGDYKQDYGYGKTIAQAGCGPTSLAMVLTYYTGESITPVETAKYAQENGFRLKNNGTSPKLFPSMCSKYGISCTSQKPTAENITTALKEGKTIIAHMGPGTFTKGGHYIVLKGITSDGKVLVADPNHPNYNKKSFAASLIAKESKASMYVMG